MPPSRCGVGLAMVWESRVREHLEAGELVAVPEDYSTPFPRPLRGRGAAAVGHAESRTMDPVAAQARPDATPRDEIIPRYPPAAGGMVLVSRLRIGALALLALGVSGLTAASAQAPPSLRVEAEASVSGDPTGVYVEPVLAVDPADSRRLAAVAIQLREPRSDRWQDRQTVVVFTSADGGRTWSPGAIEGLRSEWVAGDPWLAWGPDSRLYLSAIVGEALTRRGAVVFTGVFTSDDGGATWAGPARPFPDSTFQDHPVIAVGPSGVAVAGSIADRTGEGVYVARTHPAGEPDSWTVLRVESGWPQVNLGGAALAGDGALLLSYYTMRPPRRYAVRRVGADGRQERHRVLSDDILPLGFPPLAARGDRVYAVWPEGPEPRITLRLAFSGDGGGTWREGGSIEPRTPARARTLPAMAVAPSGAVAVVWQEFGEGSGCTYLHGAVSTDGGRSFGPASRISTEASCFGTEANGAAASRFRLGGGDYIGLAAIGEEEFQAVWADSRDGTFQILTARLVVVEP